ncbi:PLP-dependent aminotransferase family protein [Anaeroselena agilis]|uniref:PLP-dependent aminotransferase family protein n=1 Tax=Anaeroselena agilis TaxID=3063788 RepID=A0ABU3NVY1_9FIRM|nr:PLP-dependent aminotransferase family protein [Selenomonadales bacterium 4137-cl]
MGVAFASRVELLKASEIREILKITVRPEVISFAGGLPAPEVFPVEELKQAAIRVLDESGSQALQYSTTEGYEPLRRHISRRIEAKFAVKTAPENILITSGSQQALDFVGKLFLDAGDVVLCESPTYLAAISAFRTYLPKFIEVPTDDDGMVIEELAKILRSTGRVKLIYVIPDFQNPTGRTWSVERRRQFAELIQEFEIPVVEDNPYGELRFEGVIPPSIKSFDAKGLVIFVSTFSKIFCPGMRIGWIAAAENFFEKLVLIKQGADLHTSSISQQEIAKYLELFDIDAHVQKIIEVYRRRRDAMLGSIDALFPADVRHTYPQGGLFTWVELPAGYKSVELLKRCLERNVAFVPGDPFFPNNQIDNTLRLNFSNMPEERICEGIGRMAQVIKEYK